MMRYLEWLFPVLRCGRLRRPSGKVRVVLAVCLGIPAIWAGLIAVDVAYVSWAAVAARGWSWTGTGVGTPLGMAYLRGRFQGILDGQYFWYSFIWTLMPIVAHWILVSGVSWNMRELRHVPKFRRMMDECAALTWQTAAWLAILLPIASMVLGVGDFREPGIELGFAWPFAFLAFLVIAVHQVDAAVRLFRDGPICWECGCTLIGTRSSQCPECGDDTALRPSRDGPICMECSYLLVGLQSSQCPECGSDVGRAVEHPERQIERIGRQRELEGRREG